MRVNNVASVLAGMALVAGCKSNDKPAVTATGSAAAPAIVLTLVGCSPAVAAPRGGEPVVAPPPPPVDAPAPAPTLGGRPSVVASPVKIEGQLDVTRVQRVIEQQRARFESCYQQRLAQVPTLAGGVAVRFIVESSGEVTKVKAATDDVALGTCFADAIKAVAYPAPKQGVAQVTAAFTLALDVNPAKRPPMLGGSAAPVVEVKQPEPVASSTEPVAPKQWTPYATSALPASRPEVARAVAAAITGKLGQLELCFGQRPGSLRAMVRVSQTGVVSEVRSGGLGDAKVEGCVTSAILQLEVARPESEIELACDFVRGTAAPWHVAPDAYAVFTVDKAAIQYDGKVVTSAPTLPRDRSALVVAAPDAPNELVERVVAWTGLAPATLVAMSDLSGAALIGVARGRVFTDAKRPPVPVVSVAAQHALVCLGDTPRGAPVPGSGLGSAFDTALAELATACTKESCADHAMLQAAPDVTVAELATIATAVRRAGFERITFGPRTCLPAP